MAAPYRFKAKQGATLNRLFTWKVRQTPGDPESPLVPVNLTGCTARMQARSTVEDADTLFDLTTANGGIVLGGVAGTIRIVAASTLTSTWPAGVYAYELELTMADGSVRDLMDGDFDLAPEVTR